MARASCPKCQRLMLHCICELVTPITARTLLTLVQYPGEELHPLGTAALVEHCLGCPLIRTEQLLSRPQSWPDDTALLFPADDAKCLSSLVKPPSHLVVIDGTWRKALRLYEQSPALKSLPTVALPQGTVSRYRLRRSRKQGALSTVEAISRALALLEPGLCLEPLDHAFDGLIQRAMARLPLAARQHYE